MVCEKVSEFPPALKTFWKATQPTNMKQICLEIVSKTEVSIKGNHTGKEIAEKLDRNLIK